MATDTVLSVQSLVKTFGAVHALVGLCCEVRAGEIVGLLGPNGAGKTTTLQLIMGMLRPSSGKATVLGLDCTRDGPAVKRLVGYSCDEPAFHDFLTGRETIEFVLQVRGLRGREKASRARSLIAALNFESSLDVPIVAYSLGAKKKLALITALAHDPKLLLLDEPSNGLDPPTALQLRSILRDRADAGTAVVVSTHVLSAAEQLCDRFLVLDRGRLVADGTMASLREKTESPHDAVLDEVFLRLLNSPT